MQKDLRAINKSLILVLKSFRKYVKCLNVVNECIVTTLGE